MLGKIKSEVRSQNAEGKDMILDKTKAEFRIQKAEVRMQKKKTRYWMLDSGYSIQTEFRIQKAELSPTGELRIMN